MIEAPSTQPEGEEAKSGRASAGGRPDTPFTVVPGNAERALRALFVCNAVNVARGTS